MRYQRFFGRRVFNHSTGKHLLVSHHTIASRSLRMTPPASFNHFTAKHLLVSHHTIASRSLRMTPPDSFNHFTGKHPLISHLTIASRSLRMKDKGVISGHCNLCFLKPEP